MRLILVAAALACGLSTAFAQGPPASAPTVPPAQSQRTRAPLPADVTTHHELALPKGALKFSATAGAIRLPDEHDAPAAEVTFVAYQLDGADAAARPITFVFNGGPGMSSGWLHVGVIGPWRIDLGPPSTSPVPVPNAETWLDATDLVFLDPPGTGYARILGGDDVRKRVWSVNGDVNAVAGAIRRWLDRNNRSVSPKYLMGESYGGFRAPRVARRLQSELGVGVSGLILISPLLDTHRESDDYDPMGWVDRLPSLVATTRAATGPVTRAQMADVEAYAAGDYLADLLKGYGDQDAIGRASEKVAALTGLDPALVRRYQGRLDADVFLHAIGRDTDRLGSIYDATIKQDDPYPHRTLSTPPDAVLEGFQAPVTSAMIALYSDKLNWRPDGLYRLANNAVWPQWDWGSGIGRPNALDALRVAMSLDPAMRVLIAHGLFDLRTPYFATELQRRMLPAGLSDRIHFAVYPGGHMFYSIEASRTAFRADGNWVFARP